MKTFMWYVAIPSTVIFIIQLVMLLTGFGDVDHDVDFSHDGTTGDHHDGDGFFRPLTIRNLIVFFMMFGWVGIACINSGISETSTVILSTVAGIFSAGTVMMILYSMSKLQSSGTANIEECVGKIATVYIPLSKSMAGLIQVAFCGSIKELKAVTKDDEEYKQGTTVKIVSAIEHDTVEVTGIL